MPERLAEQLLQITYGDICLKEVAEAFRDRILEGNFTRAENPRSHFSTFFIAFDQAAKKVFIGHHIKSGLWIPNGGHMEIGENPRDAFRREVFEEWGDIGIDVSEIPVALLTITQIDNDRQTCKTHFDFWFFVPVNSQTFRPDHEKLLEEFHEAKWMSFEEAGAIISDPATLQSLDKIEKY